MAAASDDRPFNLLVLPGDGVGPEVIDQTLRVVDWFAGDLGRRIELSEDIVGGAAIDVHGVPISEAAVAKALSADAVLFGAVGGEKWDDQPIALRPEAGLLRLRKDMDLFANLRPAVCYPELVDASSLKPELVQGLDILIIRELTAGVYFGVPRGVEELADGRSRAFDTQAYTSDEVERVCRRPSTSPESAAARSVRWTRPTSCRRAPSGAGSPRGWVRTTPTWSSATCTPTTAPCSCCGGPSSSTSWSPTICSATSCRTQRRC